MRIEPASPWRAFSFALPLARIGVHARAHLDLRTMRCPVSGKRCTAGFLPYLPGRTAVRELERPGLAQPRGAFERSQAGVGGWSRSARNWRRAGFRDRAARAVGTGSRWMRDVGLHTAAHQ